MPEDMVMENARDFKGSIRMLLRYLWRYLPGILAALGCSAVGTLLTVIGPEYLGRLTNLITGCLGGGPDLSGITRLCLTLAGLYLTSLIFGCTQGYIMETVSQRVSRSLRRDIDGKIDLLPLGYFDKTPYGDVLSRVTNDVDTIGMSLSESIVNMLSSLLMLLGAVVMMLLTSPLLAAVAVGASLLGFGVMALVISRTQKLFFARQERLGALNGFIEEQYGGIEILKAYGGEAAARETFRSLNQALRDVVWKAEFFSGLMMRFMDFTGNLGYVAVCAAGGILALEGKISFGVIVSFIVYVRLFTQPLTTLAQIATTLQSTAAASERVFTFLNEPELAPEPDAGSVPAGRGEVEFQHLRFGYTPEKTVIHDFSAHALPGQKIAIVGPTGAGKTTLVNLLMRFYEPEGGRILIDGVDTASMTRAAVHDQFCMVLQDAWLFEGSIRENLTYTRQNVPDSVLDAAVAAVGLDKYVSQLPQGYDTVLSDRANLSVGQRQQLAIARAIVEDAPILILDEATSSVDTRIEQVIQSAMDRLCQGRTSFVIAHRLSTVKNADLILCIRDGDIVEQGDHATLLRQDGFYASLWRSQFSD